MSEKRSELQQQLIEKMLDGMDPKGLLQLAYEHLNQVFDTYSEKELAEQLEEQYPEGWLDE